MFISTKALTKLMKESYKARLNVGCFDEGILIFGADYAVWMEGKYVPNKVKALIIELAGRLPKDNELFWISKDNPKPKVDVEKPKTMSNLFGDIDKAMVKLYDTKLKISHHKELRLFQDSYTDKIIEIDARLPRLIDKSEIDFGIEGEPTGPCHALESPSIYWYNELGKVMVLPIEERKEKSLLFEALERVDFDDDAKR